MESSTERLLAALARAVSAAAGLIPRGRERDLADGRRGRGGGRLSGCLFVENLGGGGRVGLDGEPAAIS